MLAVSNAQASWAYVPLELRMAGAKYIVVGKIDRIVDGIERNKRTYDVGAIKVSKVLKGPKTLKEVKLMWPGPAPFALSTDIKFCKGQEGVWILYPDQKVKDVFWASYPTDYQALANLPKVQEKMKALNSIRWSKSVDGLQLGAIIEKRDVRKQKIVVKGRPVKALARATVYVVLRNTGKALTHAVNFPHDKQITFKITGPDGKDMPLEMRFPAGRVWVSFPSHGTRKHSKRRLWCWAANACSIWKIFTGVGVRKQARGGKACERKSVERSTACQDHIQREVIPYSSTKKAARVGGFC